MKSSSNKKKLTSTVNNLLQLNINKGITEHKKGNLLEAKKHYEDVLKREPNSFDAMHLLGAVLQQLKKPNLSVELLKKAIEIDSKVAAVHSNLGCAFLDLNRLDEALNSFNEAIKLKPKYAEAHANKGNALKALGKNLEALASYELALIIKPNFAEALSNRATILLALGNFKESLECNKKAILICPSNAELHYNYANSLFAMGELEEAISNYEIAIKLFPNYAEAYANCANVFKILKNLNKAISYYEKAIDIKPTLAEAYLNYGFLLQEIKLIEKAFNQYEYAIKIRPKYAEAYFAKGNLLLYLNRWIEALESYNQAISINPLFAEAYSNRGNALRALRESDQAIESFRKAIDLKNDYADAYSNLGAVFQECNLLDAAIEVFHMAIKLKPNFAEAYCNLGNALLESEKNLESLEYCEKAIEIKPELAEAHFNRANSLKKLGRIEDALNGYEKAISLKPNYADAYRNKGQTLQEAHLIDEALAQYEKAYQLNPECEFLLGILLHSRYKICNWTDFNINNKLLTEKVLKKEKVTFSFATLAIIDSPHIHKIASEVWTATKHKTNNKLGILIHKEQSNEKKIRIGYYSADFYNHATSYLMAELFELHDKKKFEIYAFVFGQSKTDDMRLRLATQFDYFIDVHKKSDEEIASLSRELEIDIAIDLKGFTQDSRSGIFAYRCAPIQVNYLGYPGTLGAKYFDYIVADRTLIPEESKVHYTEKIVYLPNSYQVNDSKRKISENFFSKSELGLPTTGFVFCCFNNNYKITPSTFDCWMRILKTVQESVLWLFEDNPIAANNLRKEAEKRGVDRNRLVFAKRMSLDEHLARHRLADLFIDTLPYNAHTTASDALWAGLPVLTLIGESFAARVAASLLNAIGLPELITATQEEYEAKAIDLASNPLLLKQIKQKLAQNRLTKPLFNTRQFAKNIEAAYTAMYERYQQDLAPDHLYIEDVWAKQEPSSFIKIEIPSNSMNKPNVKLLDIFEVDAFIQVLDIGASAINEVPFYKPLLETGLAHLNAFEGDPRQIENIKSTYKSNCTIFNEFLFDGTEQTLYVASEASGMSSLLKPNQSALNFFNGFDQFGRIERTEKIKTKRLDDVTDIKKIDVLKMDIQGAELTVLQNASEKLKNCLVVQLEVSYITLYENQPSFGDIDVWMRKQGYVPHCFLDIKRWSIAPTIFNNNFRVPGNQLLESDIVYIKDPLKLEMLSDQQIIKFVAVTHYALRSFDLTIYLLLELARRKIAPADIQNIYLKNLNTK